MSNILSPISVSLNSPSPSNSNNTSTFPSATTPASFNAQLGPGRKGSDGLLIPTDRTREELEKWLPKLGRLKVLKEVVLPGYSLYSLRTWYLSRTHWSQTIVTQTGKPAEQISAYLLVPDPDLSTQAGGLELASATQFLVTETHSQPRKTEYGTLLVTTPSVFGQDVFPIPGGDLREMKPYLILNTNLRRLGCGGRAAMGMESPISAVRRKYYELYRLPTPANNVALSRTNSPTTSPTRTTYSPSSITATSPHPILQDPLSLIIVEMVKLVQAALAIWGVYGVDKEEVEVDGLFCDETKAGIFQWRRLMGIEHEESMRLEKETSGGCIDPKTLAALLSSITSVRYQLAALGVEKLPKDPFTSIGRFLQAWRSYQVLLGRGIDYSPYLTVHCVNTLHTQYLTERTRSPSDALKVHRLLAGIGHATSSIHANLKGGAAEDTPLRKREHHLRFKAGSDNLDTDSGVGMIIPEGQVGSVAPPDIITSDLEAYTKGILKSRQKDWDVMGARRVAGLWNGQIVDYGRGNRGQVLKKGSVREEDGEEMGAAKGALAWTGQALKGGFGLVSRKNTIYDTSDSEAGPGPSSLKNTLMRRKQSTVPTVVEPDVEEIDENLGNFSTSPSPNISTRQLDRSNGVIAKSLLTAPSRPSLITRPSNDGSEAPSRKSFRPTSSPTEDRWDGAIVDRAAAWKNREAATAMLRTCSDGADVVLEEGGMEWEVVEPHGTSKGRGEVMSQGLVQRRHSLQDRVAYEDTRISPAEHLAIDVEMSAIVMQLRQRERDLAIRARDMRILENSITTACKQLSTHLNERKDQMRNLETQAAQVEGFLQRKLDEAENHHLLRHVSDRVKYYLSEDTNVHEVSWSLRDLRKKWEEVRRANEERVKDGGEEDGGWGWWGWKFW